MLLTCTGLPNVHLKYLNPHIETAAYPALFQTELIDSGDGVGIAGVSSFGVGGTNARADVWGRAVIGHRASYAVDTFKQLHLRHQHFLMVKDRGQPGPMLGDTLYIIGTMSAWTQYEEMETTEEGVFKGKITLGPSLREQFRIVLDEKQDQAFYPENKQPGVNSFIRGPDFEGEGKGWLIDGRSDGNSAGTTYEVTFEWGFSWDSGEYKTIKWAPIDQSEPLPTTPKADTTEEEGSLVLSRAVQFEHSFSVVGTFSAWKPRKMMPSMQNASVFCLTDVIGVTREEEFQIWRDGDSLQALYPETEKAIKSSIPIMGPDDQGKGRNWLIRGPFREEFTIELDTRNSGLSVSLVSETKGKKTWHMA